MMLKATITFCTVDYLLEEHRVRLLLLSTTNFGMVTIAECRALSGPEVAQFGGPLPQSLTCQRMPTWVG